MTPAERLRAAATKVREQAAKATPGPWDTYHQDTVVETVPPVVFEKAFGHDVVGEWQCSYEDADWIVMMGPQNAEPLARWLEEQAAVWESVDLRTYAVAPPALELADRILGTT